MKDLKYGLFFNNTSKQFTERGFEAILSVVLTIGVIFLLQLFPVMGIAIAIFVYSFLCVGAKRYLISIAKDEFLPIESIFSTYKISIKAFCLKFATILITLLWSVVFIIPGIITALNYVFSSFVLAENNNQSALECMAKSKKIVSGYRMEILVVYLAYFFVILAAMCIFAAIGIAIKTYTNVNTWVPIVGTIIAYLFVLIVFIIPYFELMFANIYLILKDKKSKPSQNQVSKRPYAKKSAVSTKSE